MKFFAVEYPNFTTLIVKSEFKLERVLIEVSNATGMKSSTGTIYNPQTFLSLRELMHPDKRQQFIAQELSKVLIG